MVLWLMLICWLKMKRSINDTINDTIKLSERQIAILNLIKSNNKVSYLQISDAVSISKITVRREIDLLRNYGFLKRDGSKKDGSWIVITK